MSDRQFALLIDGDNAEASLLAEILKTVEGYGDAIIRRIYGDWTEPQMNSWKPMLNNYSIQPIQQFRYTTGKNATDSALIIDAMDILYTSDVSGFCIVSSDSDYTRLAQRIRENNLFVLGIGRKNTPLAFKNACNEFVFTEKLKPKKPQKNAQQNSTSKKKSTKMKKPTKKLANLFIKAFDDAVNDKGWATLSALGSHMRKIDPNFEPKTFGYKQLSQLIKEYPDFFEIRQKGKVYYVRIRT